jgi:hypothetical protein
MACEYCDQEHLEPIAVCASEGWSMTLVNDEGRGCWELVHERLTPPYGCVVESRARVRNCPMCGRALPSSCDDGTPPDGHAGGDMT